MHTIGTWIGDGGAPAFSPAEILAVSQSFREPVHVVVDPNAGSIGVTQGGTIARSSDGGLPLLASLPATYPEWLGDRSFGEVHGVRFPYVAGAMANGIASTRLVIAMARGGCLGFFGSAGLSPGRVEASIVELTRELGDRHSWGANLIHSPNEPALENAVVDLYLRHGVRKVSAAAYMALTPAIVRYAYKGVRRGADGRIERPHHVFAKISRPETARHFLEPAPAKILDGLVASGGLTAAEAELARGLPVAEDITVESDSGGHTDNRPLTALFPTIARLRDDIAAQRRYARPIRVGAAGGLGTPASVAAAFGLGAAYVVTGSVNQGAVESGLDPEGKVMLAQAGIADVTMAPAADMFEQGVEVQVLSRGTMFAARARKLYELYRAAPSWESIAPADQKRVERDLLRQSFAEAWASTHAFWAERDPEQNRQAEADPKHKMALVFRSYLGRSSRWAIDGAQERRLDYQIWCGPAMGAFNAWAKGSVLEAPENRSAVQIAHNFLEGATAITRAAQLRSFGVPVPAQAFDFRPRRIA